MSKRSKQETASKRAADGENAVCRTLMNGLMRVEEKAFIVRVCSDGISPVIKRSM